MARDYELDRLKSEEQSLFQAKQTAWQRWMDAKDRADEAYEASQRAWEERCSANEIMNREFEAMKSSSEHHQEIWGEYGRIRDYNNAQIESLKREADYEHQQMCSCFDQASSAYEYGDKSMAPIYSQEGHEHKDRRDELNAEISELAREVKEARQDAECRAPKTDSLAFHSAQNAFNRAKEYNQRLETEFKRLKAERDRLKAEFDRLQEDHKRAKVAFQNRLEEVKSANQRERDRTLDKAGVRYSERADAKIVKKSDGTTQVYHGGLGKGDGIGHGHTTLDQSGRVSYDRDAFAEHGSQNYTDAKFGTFDGKSAKIYPDKRHGHEGWQNILYSDKGVFKPGHDHGHVILDENGSVRLWRDQGQTRGKEWYLDEAKDDHTKI